MDIEKIITQSVTWRLDRIENRDTEAVRLFAGISDGIEGILIEQYGPFILGTIYNPGIVQYKGRILNILTELFPKKSILIKARDGQNSNDFQYTSNDLYDKKSILNCNEGESKFEIHTDPRHDYGLYLDTKASRNFLTKISKDKKVLNLFSYTCAFGVAAMTGGAESVTNIDPNKDYLEWGRKNADLNGVIFKRYPDTTQDYLARHVRRLESGKDVPYDITVVDPPAFLVGRGAKRLARNMWPEWMGNLKAGKCKEFIIIINDKSFGRQHDLGQFFRNGLGEDIDISIIDQSFDVEGQLLSKQEDKFYFNPIIFHIKVK